MVSIPSKSSLLYPARLFTHFSPFHFFPCSISVVYFNINSLLCKYYWIFFWAKFHKIKIDKMVIVLEFLDVKRKRRIIRA